ncbi:GntR family transcriptional regulator [Streptomyces spiroverticillatus]|uniref:GntR family transcriptional regulator n=1 Tax=Streptomyces finlayi TaxID=67296 RepID=A0A918WTL0_9ACTN|nr:winged helix-turn-helix domain-containing protein [Streptomyces finlayi]GGZ97141.1 GntR family transcriptional regulator [Streptomyces spiroverticillatus]GHC82342.1 GntR family transcriptional regulator [Streptomyces finlayi]
MADALRTRIRTGELRPGDRMPTQAQLAEEYEVERGAVRQALRILAEERLLTNVTKGSPATVAGDAPAALGAGAAASPQPTMVALGSRITEAFEADHVEIDALCLTAISLTLGFGDALRRVHEGRVRPSRITVRVLLPSRDIDLAFPTPVADGNDARLHGRWLQQRNAQGQVLRHNLVNLRRTHGIDVKISFRALPFTPPVKLYLLNNSEALFAYYMITKQKEHFDQDREPLEMYDTVGTRSMLFPFDQRTGGQRDGTFVEQSQLWFDAIWNTISQDLNLAAN